MLELRALTHLSGGEELVKIELVELPGAGDGHQLFRHLIREQPHLRQGAIRVPPVGVPGSEILFGTLLVGVRPVEDLFLDELAGGQRPKRRAGEVEVSLGRDGQKLGFLFREHGNIFVHILQPGGIFCLKFLLGDRVLLALEEFSRGFPPSSKVILIEDDQIPFHLVEPFVIRLDVPYRVAAEQILEGAEIDERFAG